MSALPPKADMCGATSNVRYGPKADIKCGVGHPRFCGRQVVERRRLNDGLAERSGGAPVVSQEGAHDNIDHLVDPIVARYIAGIEGQPWL
jgi:hypothetical protein